VVLVPDWYEKLEFFISDDFQRIIEFVGAERRAGKQILPADRDILNAFYYTPLETVKAVILGQDPYPNPQFPEGLAFSVNASIEKLPSSLANIFAELRADLRAVPANGSLIPWAEQGVLLLNTSLTVEAHRSNSHATLGWDKLVDEAVQCVNDNLNNVVFILWGTAAQQKSKFIDRRRHHIITSAHPSPLSAHRGFFGSKPFSRCNAYLVEHGREPIRW
jgi:uracil-DNA glycosylase